MTNGDVSRVTINSTSLYSLAIAYKCES